MLETRGLRDQQAPCAIRPGQRPGRTLLGADQETWLFSSCDARRGRDRLACSASRSCSSSGPNRHGAAEHRRWDGYPAGPARVFDFLESEKISDRLSCRRHPQLVGDDVPRNPFADIPQRSRLDGSEFVTPAISSPPSSLSPAIARRHAAPTAAPHLNIWRRSRGYMVLDVDRKAIRADWSSCRRWRSEATPRRTPSVRVQRGSSRLASA